MVVLPLVKRIAMRTASKLVSPPFVRQRLLILTYHRVLERPDPLLPECIDRKTFATHLDVLIKHFNVLPLAVALSRLQEGRLPPRAVSITFDDGYADNFEVVLPMLQNSGVAATFFISTGFLDGGRMWNDTVIEVVRRVVGETLDLGSLGLGVMSIDSTEKRRIAVRMLLERIKRLRWEERTTTVERMADQVGAELPEDLMLTSEQVVALSDAGMEIGAHTVCHPILTCMTNALAKKEIHDCRDQLRQLLGENVSGFAYPNGKPGLDYASEHIDAVRRAGFLYAVSTAHGCARFGSDQFQLPRCAPWDRDPFKLGLRLLSEFTTGPGQII